MALPKNFIFNQGNLQDFTECRRRFYLRYVLKLRWPAVQSEPYLENERFLQRGSDFHRRVHQYFLGVDKDRIATSFASEELASWWQNFIDYIDKIPAITDPGSKKYPEHILTTMVAGHRLIAKYDLICISTDGSLRIYDWKTSRVKPNRKWLAGRLQTIAYPTLVTLAGAALNDHQPVPPEQVELVYWYTSLPEKSHIFKFNAGEFARSRTVLSDMMTLINRLAESGGEADFPKTDDLKKCAFCVFRSLCERGDKAGLGSDESLLDEAEVIEFDFDQITELMIG